VVQGAGEAEFQPAGRPLSIFVYFFMQRWDKQCKWAGANAPDATVAAAIRRPMRQQWPISRKSEMVSL
jgi:hypothetical protein